MIVYKYSSLREFERMSIYSPTKRNCECIIEVHDRIGEEGATRKSS